MTQKRAAVAGKRDPYCRSVGSFCIAAMPVGTYDYFPVGQPPHIVNDGGIKKVGRIVERYVLTGKVWRHILVEDA